MMVFILTYSNAEKIALSIKRVFSDLKTLDEYLGSLIPVGGHIKKWISREEPDIDGSIADIEIKYSDGSMHYYKVYQMDVKGL